MRDAFLLHGSPWVEQDPNKQEYSLDKMRGRTTHFKSKLDIVSKTHDIRG